MTRRHWIINICFFIVLFIGYSILNYFGPGTVHWQENFIKALLFTIGFIVLEFILSRKRKRK